MEVYQYTNISTINLSKIHYEVANSSMTDKSIKHARWDEKTQILQATFINSLSGEDKTLLDTIISNHITGYPEGEFSPDMYLARLTQEFSALDRKKLSKASPSFITELMFKNFSACKILVDTAYMDTELTLAERDTLYSLFSEQSIDLEDYTISGV